MNQAMERAKIEFANRLNAHFRPRTDVDQELFLVDLFEHLGARTPRELNRVATLIIQNHKAQVWPSVAHVLDYASKVSATTGLTVIEKGTPEWDAERQRRQEGGLSVSLMDKLDKWTIGARQAG